VGSNPRLLVTGSREWDNFPFIEKTLEIAHQYLGPGTVLVHGGARGADSIARYLWERQGLPAEVHHTSDEDWRRFGRKAGMLRNQRMVDLGADLCLAFSRNASSGTAGCALKARIAGIRTFLFDYDTVDLAGTPDIRAAALPPL
jgi:hypothetical protein